RSVTLDRSQTRHPARATLFPYTTLFRSIVSRRLAKIALREDSPILSGYFSDSEGWKRFDLVTVGAVAKQGAWKEALALIEQEYRSEEHTSELQSRENLVCRLLLEKKKSG